MDEDESLLRYGLRPGGRELAAVRALLEVEAGKERRAQGDGDTELMKLCCVQPFNAGAVGDALAIWRAKTASWDAHCSIDVQLLCGAGLAETKAFLSAQRSEEARAALQWLLHSEAAGDFQDFSVVERSAWYATYNLGA
jgi:hypothetical protein